MVEPGAKNPNAKQVCSSGSIASYRSQVSTMPDAKLWSLSLLSRIVSAIHGRVGGGVHGSIPPPSICPFSLQNVGAGLRGGSVNPAIRFGRIVRNKLDGDG